MGNVGADRASPIGAPAGAPAGVSAPAHEPVAAALPVSDPSAPRETPLWMEGSAPRPAPRRGHAAAVPRSGLPTVLFFGVIILAVGAAGAAGVALWGPEKTIKNRTQFASHPPTPLELPSLAGSDQPAPAAENEPASVSPESTAPSSAPNDAPVADAVPSPSTSAPAKAKRPSRGVKKRR
ncbi:MAG: hypothetical protein KF894_19670 [Labilithrix sp.]|nr:hypothetical protein [Labilithrix sp.]